MACTTKTRVLKKCFLPVFRVNYDYSFHREKLCLHKQSVFCKPFFSSTISPPSGKAAVRVSLSQTTTVPLACRSAASLFLSTTREPGAPGKGCQGQEASRPLCSQLAKLSATVWMWSAPKGSCAGSSALKVGDNKR